MHQKKKDQYPHNGLSSYAKYSGIAIQMMAIILIGVFGGIKIDEWIKWETPVFTILFAFLSVILAIYLVIKDLIQKDKSTKPKE
ncbi:MAG: AtpZ/AtpI family protein [Bacteroidetes bacterium]|nr:AtpZ/AtpI family protein [Bacteroidota bacterium]